MNFGAIGAVIGHELTHGFDDEGSQFDAQGNLQRLVDGRRPRAVRQAGECFVNEYDGFVAVDDVHVRGKLTLGENTADNGGLRISHMALLDVLATTPEKDKDGFTPDQRFFVGWAQVWCENDTGSRTSAGAHQRAFSSQVPRQRRGGKYASSRRPSAARPAHHGPQACLPHLVVRATGVLG